MKITKVDNCPTGLRYFEKDDLEKAVKVLHDVFELDK